MLARIIVTVALFCGLRGWADQPSPVVTAESATVDAAVTALQDWPMARYDAQRSGATMHQLDFPLHLHWVRHLPSPQRAWPAQQDDFEKLNFDESYQPVVVGDTIYVGSMTTDTISAYALDSGALRWQYWTDGPVRLAPLVWQGRVYAGSDDGYMHCLDASSGRRLWKFRAAPSGRMVLGNRRLISMWPLRGGPVIAEGSLYFAAGIWPGEGVFLYSLDALTGAVEWLNSGSSSDMIEDSKSYFSFGGVAPQGQLVVSGDRLIVPGGRTVPAVFDRHTGNQLYFHVSGKATGKAAGGHHVFSHDAWYFNRRDRYVTDMYHIADGAQFGSVFVDVVDDQAFYGLDTTKHQLYAYAADVKATQENTPQVPRLDRRGRPIPDVPLDAIERNSSIEGRLKSGVIQKSYELRTLWTADFPELRRIHVKAGQTLYGSGDAGKLFALELDPHGAEPQVRWTDQVPGEVFTMLVAQGRLLVVTTAGAIHCFGNEARETATHPAPTRALQSVGASQAQAAAILQQTDPRGGFGLVVGVESGGLLDELLQQSKLHLSVLEPNADRARELRQRYTAAGLYGVRISVHEGELVDYQLPPYFASLIACESISSLSNGGEKATVEQLFQSLRPYGGIAVLYGDGSQRLEWVAAADQADLERAEVTSADDAVWLKRPGQLPGAGSWTHQYADAANSAYSADDRVKAPLGIAWFGSSSNRHTLPRHLHGPIPHVVEGRLILMGTNQVSARCVYTGVELWVTPLVKVGQNFTSWEHEEEMALGDRTVYFPNHPGANFIGAPLVSTADSIYVLHEDRCLRIDAATGERLADFELPGADQLRQQLRQPPEEGIAGSYGSRLQQGPARRWGHIRVAGPHLVVAAYPHIFDDRQPGLVENWNATSSEFLVVMDRLTGAIRWVQQARYGYRHNAIAAGAEKLFAIDHLSDEIRQKLTRRGVQLQIQPAIQAWDLATGEPLWSFTEDVFGTSLSYSLQHDVLAQSGHPGRRAALPDEPQDRLVALRGSTGEKLWGDSLTQRRAPLGMHDAMRQILGSSGEGAVDMLTGEPLTRRNPLTGREQPWSWVGAIRCGTQNFSRHLALFRSGAAAFAELEGWATTANLPGVRPGCTNSLVVADGILNVPDYTRTCSCSYQQQTSMGLVHMPLAEMWTYTELPTDKAGAIERLGVNFGAPGSRLDRKSETLWLAYPVQVLPAPEVSLGVEVDDDAVWFHQHSAVIADDGQGVPWVAASGVIGIRQLRMSGLAKSKSHAEAPRYRVRLHFAEPEETQPGQRVFQIMVGGKGVVPAMDVAQQTGGRYRATVVEVETQSDSQGAIEIAFAQQEDSTLRPILCGIEVQAQ